MDDGGRARWRKRLLQPCDDAVDVRGLLSFSAVPAVCPAFYLAFEEAVGLTQRGQARLRDVYGVQAHEAIDESFAHQAGILRDSGDCARYRIAQHDPAAAL